jgi:hypothetical protein
MYSKQYWIHRCNVPQMSISLETKLMSFQTEDSDLKIAVLLPLKTEDLQLQKFEETT